MKKNYILLSVLLLGSIALKAQTYTLTHNLVTSLSAAEQPCLAADVMISRHFTMSDFGITSDIQLESIDLGVFQNDTQQTITVNVFASDVGFPGTFSWDPDTLLGSESFLLDPVNAGGSDFNGSELKSFLFTTPIIVPSTVTHITVEYVTNNPINFIPAVAIGTGAPGYFSSINGCGGAAAGVYLPTGQVLSGNQEYYMAIQANDATLSLEDVNLTAQDITVYPNPTTHRIHIATGRAHSLSGIKVFDLLGKEMQIVFLDDLTSDVSALSSGAYILLIETETTVISKRFLRE